MLSSLLSLITLIGYMIAMILKHVVLRRTLTFWRSRIIPNYIPHRVVIQSVMSRSQQKELDYHAAYCISCQVSLPEVTDKTYGSLLTLPTHCLNCTHEGSHRTQIWCCRSVIAMCMSPISIPWYYGNQLGVQNSGATTLDPTVLVDIWWYSRESIQKLVLGIHNICQREAKKTSWISILVKISM